MHLGNVGRLRDDLMTSQDILLVAPYQHTGLLSKQVIAKLGLEIPVEVAYDYEALDAIKRHPDCKIIISRGGTAKVLRGVPGITVVDIEASFYDVFNAVRKLLRAGCHSIAVVTQDNVIGLETCSLQLKGELVNVHPCTTPEEIEETVARVYEQGCDGVAGCVVAVESARRFNIKSEFVDSDFFSIKKAVLNAVELEHSMRSRELMLSTMTSLLNNIDEGVIVFDENGSSTYTNQKASDLLSFCERDKWHDNLAPYLKKDGSHAVLSLGDRKVLLRNLELTSGDLKNNMVVMQDSSALEENVRSMKIAVYEKGLYARTRFEDIVRKSAVMEEVVEKASKFAHSESTVMIFGETGVGKEGFAQSIHNDSPRSQMPFVSVNCASLPEGLVASELFGYAEGAFTGARRSGRKGLFEMAQGGTIFLDEVTELPMDVQSQLLRVIQEREVRRIGDDRVIPLDIRIIAAGNRRVLEMCAEGTFRYDLYYRLNVLRLAIPPLRERGDDVILLFKHFMAEFLHCDEHEILLEDEASAMLLAYQWPGNVRELRNVAEALSFSGSRVQVQDLSELITSKDRVLPGSDAAHIVFSDTISLMDVEKQYLKHLLSKHSITECVRISGLSRTTLWRRLRELSLEI